MYQIFHKSVLHQGIVLNLDEKSTNYLTALFSEVEADDFVSKSNANAERQNLTLRYRKVKAPNILKKAG